MTDVEDAAHLGADLEEIDYELAIPFDFFGPGITTASNDQETRSIYFQIVPKITETIQLTFGMRRSSVENDMKDGFSFPTGLKFDDDITVNELGLSFYVDDDTKLTVRYDENFRFAKVNELALAETNTVLNTQTGESIEIGANLAWGDYQLIASIYQLNLEDEIVFDPTVGPDIGFGPTGLNVNLDKTQRSGATLSLVSQPISNLSIKTELGLVNARFKSGLFKGNDISGVAGKTANIRADYQFRENLASYLEVHYTGEKFAQGDNANVNSKLESFTILNAGISYQKKNWDINFRINNLSDEKYAEFISSFVAYFPNPERNFMLTTSYQFQ
ncbi:MAG: TonB-dependent receptor [Proteobacteria bacterium]|nr:TonB-dependent receptor [Pseudomonadota bacterium]